MTATSLPLLVVTEEIKVLVEPAIGVSREEIFCSCAFVVFTSFPTPASEVK